MFLFTIAFLIGDLYLQSFAVLPKPFFVGFLLAAGFLFWIFCRKKWALNYLPFAFILGFVWSAWYANHLLSWSLAKEFENQSIIITGTIASLPTSDNWGENFIFLADKFQKKNIIKYESAYLRLSWSNLNETLKVGDRWRLNVRLKRIHGLQNPGGFDYEAWSLQKGLRAKGYVLTKADNILIAHHWYTLPIHQFRQLLQENIERYAPHTKMTPWLIALIIGERNHIPSEHWQVLRNTGTNHLMAIAGLHIGLMAGFTHIIVSWLWRCSRRLPLIFPASQAGASCAVLIAILYSLLAGFSIPTQRACIMLSIFILTLLTRRQINSWYPWSLALLLVLLLNPLSVLTESFWLSFGTIALIIYGMGGRLAPTGKWWKWFRVQWVIGLGLFPLSLFLFQECSLISFIANSIAIPWLGFFVLPFCFLSALFLLISPTIGTLLLFLADKSLSGLWIVLTWFSHLQFSTWHQAVPYQGFLFLTFMGVFLLLLPVGFPGRWFGLIWLMPLAFYKPIRPSTGDFWLTILDVGQGLAAIVQTKHHLLVYDAGPKYSENFDVGETVILPYLNSIYATKVNMLVISHGDNDHIGGAQALIKSLALKSIKTSVPEKLKLPKEKKFYCLAGNTWTWDHVKFTFLHPTLDTLNMGNDSSCVLLIDNSKQRILLAGDIEKKAEKILLEEMPEKLQAEILIAPHHGSKTSGIKEFVLTVSPRFVIYATGYLNRYHFPHQHVTQIYTEIGSQQLNTAYTGAIHFKLTQSPSILQPELYRVTHNRYWMTDNQG